MEISDQEFAELIAAALDELPPKYARNMDNVVIVYDDEPNALQREKLRLRHDQSLYGLYEGIPLPQRNAGYNLVLPDKITLFKLPIAQSSRDMAALKAQVKHTLWHELAHHFGLDHERIYELEDRATDKHH